MAFTEKYVSRPNTWVTATVYALDDSVIDVSRGDNYYCILAHTSGDTDDKPGVGATWTTYWALGDGTTEIKAWSLQQAWDSSVAGERVNIKKAVCRTYSVRHGPTNAGTQEQIINYRGYTTTIGDLDATGRFLTGKLDTTGFPQININSNNGIVPKNYTVYENMYITGSSTTTIWGQTTPADFVGLINMHVRTTRNSANSRAAAFGEGGFAINCDLEATSASGGYMAVTSVGNNHKFIGCRFYGGYGKLVKDARWVSFYECVFISADGTGYGISELTGGVLVVDQCTFYNLGTCIELAATADNRQTILTNNMVGDCTKWIDNLYAATADKYVIEYNNVLRNVTTPRTGIGDGLLSRERTFAGSVEEDYMDPHATTVLTNLLLLKGGAGENEGMTDVSDVGAFQIDNDGDIA